MLCKIAVAIQKSNKKDLSSARHLLTWNSTPSKSENNCQYLANPSFNRCNFIYTGQFLKFHLKGNFSNIQAAKHTKKMILNKDFRPWYLDWLLQHDFWNVALQTHVSRLQWPAGGLQFSRKNPRNPDLFLGKKWGGTRTKKRGRFFLTGRFKTWKICGIFGGSSWKG